jgi:hypothetical protein
LVVKQQTVLAIGRDGHHYTCLKGKRQSQHEAQPIMHAKMDFSGENFGAKMTSLFVHYTM